MSPNYLLDDSQETLFDVGRRPQSEQFRFVQMCIDEGLDFADELERHGISIDDLEYEIKAPSVRGDYATLDRFRHSSNRIPFVSLFAGCGGMNLGFEAAGFSHQVAVEINPLFARTMRENRPNWNVMAPPSHSGDVSRLYETANGIKEQAKITIPYEGIFVGEPPCQPFSIAANQRFSRAGGDFKRTGFQHKHGNLLFCYIELIEMFLPLSFVIENVPGLVDVDNGEQIANAVHRLRLLGYDVAEPLILNAADFQVPQNRFRLFLIGSRGTRTFVPPPKSDKASIVGPALRLGKKSVNNHQPREHKAASILRYMQLAVGERDQLGRVDRLDPLRPSKTIIAGGTKGGGRSHLHPYIPRTLTVRECARIQTFPDDYVFLGPTARQFTQVGNAVPPVLAAQIASSVRKSFF